MGIYEHFAAKGINPVLRTGFISSATGSGHVITCTARRWVVSGQLYCFQLPPARGRREACKPSADPTSRITNVRINRTAAHRSIFRPAFVKSARRTESTPSPLCHRQDEKSSRKRRVRLSRRASSWRKIQSIFRLNRRRPAIGRTKNYSSSSDRICSINRS